MATEQELAAQLKASQDETAALKAKMAAIESEAGDIASIKKSNEELSAKTAALEAENKRMALEREKETVLKKYPDAASFADMIQGKDSAEMDANAKKIADRIALEKASAVKAKEVELKAQWGDIQIGRSSLALSQTEWEQKMADAKKAGNILEQIKLKFTRPKTQPA